MLFLCICIFRYSFYNCALVYCTRDGAIFSIHSFQGFFQTPKQGWANMDSIPFSYLYTNRHEFVELYWQKKWLKSIWKSYCSYLCLSLPYYLAYGNQKNGKVTWEKYGTINSSSVIVSNHKIEINLWSTKLISRIKFLYWYLWCCCLCLSQHNHSLLVWTMPKHALAN